MTIDDDLGCGGGIGFMDSRMVLVDIVEAYRDGFSFILILLLFPFFSTYIACAFLLSPLFGS